LEVYEQPFIIHDFLFSDINLLERDDKAWEFFSANWLTVSYSWSTFEAHRRYHGSWWSETMGIAAWNAHGAHEFDNMFYLSSRSARLQRTPWALEGTPAHTTWSNHGEFLSSTTYCMSAIR
jgi:hypothetical protein